MDPSTYAERERICDMGFLRHPYRSFCKIKQVWYEPHTKLVQFKTQSCVYKDDQERLKEQGSKFIQKGLNILENYSK